MSVALQEVAHGTPQALLILTSDYAECMAEQPVLRPGAGKTVRFVEFLAAELQQRAMGVADLAHATGLRYTVIQRWLDADESRRVVPSPTNCHAVADALGIDELVVLGAAGHVRGREMTARPRPPFWEELQALHRREERSLSDLSPEQWVFARSIIEMRIDSTRVLIERHIEAVERALRGTTSDDDRG